MSASISIGNRKVVENFGVIGQVPHPTLQTYNVTLALDAERAVVWSVFSKSHFEAVLAARANGLHLRPDCGTELVPLAVELAGDPWGIKYLTTKFLDLTQDDTFTLKPGTRVFIMDAGVTPTADALTATVKGRGVEVIRGGANRAYFLEVDRYYWVEGSDGVWYAVKAVAP